MQVIIMKVKDRFTENGFLLNVEKTNIILCSTLQTQIETPKTANILNDKLNIHENTKF